MSTIKSSAENLTLNADGANNDIKFQSNGSEVASIDQAGVLVSAGGSTHADNVKAKFGTGNDAEIYHDGTHTYYKNSHTSGSTRFNQKYFEVNNTAGTESMLSAYEDGAVTLRHNNAVKLETTATGVAVTGGVAIGGTGTANTLDDYEEGNWTPSGVNFTVGTVHFAKYTKIGNVVTLQAYFIASSGGSGSADLNGMPFTSSGGYSTGVINMSSANTTVTNPHVRTSSGSTAMTLKKNLDTPLVGTEVDAGHFIFSVTYTTA